MRSLVREGSLKNLNARQSENVLEFLKIPFSNRFKVFYLHLELPSDQQNKNGFAAERMWFPRHRVYRANSVRFDAKIFLKTFKIS